MGPELFFFHPITQHSVEAGFEPSLQYLNVSIYKV